TVVFQASPPVKRTMALTLGDQPTPHSQVRSSPALAEPAATFGSHVCAFSNDFAGRASERCRRPPSGSGFQRHQRHDCHILQYLMAPCGGPEPVGLDHARIGSLNLPPVSTWSYDLSGLLGLTWVSVPLSLGVTVALAVFFAVPARIHPR